MNGLMLCLVTDMDVLMQEEKLSAHFQQKNGLTAAGLYVATKITCTVGGPMLHLMRSKVTAPGSCCLEHKVVFEVTIHGCVPSLSPLGVVIQNELLATPCADPVASSNVNTKVMNI